MLFLSVKILTVLTSDQRTLHWTMQDNNPGKFIAVQLLAEHTTDPGDTASPHLIIHKKMAAESPTYAEHCGWEHRTVGYAYLQIYFLNTVSPVPTSFPIFQPFPLKPWIYRWSWRYRWKRQGKGGKACRSQQWCWWEKSDSSYFQSFDLPNRIYWILCIASQPAYKILSPLEITSWMLGKLLTR